MLLTKAFRHLSTVSALLLTSAFVGAVTDNGAVPPSQVYAVDLGASGARTLFETGHGVDHQADSVGTFSFLARKRFQNTPFYFSGGVRGERFDMQSAHGFPIHTLQDYAAQFSIEYFVGDIEAAHLTVFPGFYFENHPNGTSWDVPFELVSGVPITSKLNGAVGVSYGRFWKNPLPIAGLIYTFSPDWRLEAIYPDPSLVYTINKSLEARLAGELLGDGFRSDSHPDRKVVQYYVYRAGADLAWKITPWFKMTSGAGVEYERVFDYWRAGQSFKATRAPYVRLGFEFSH